MAGALGSAGTHDATNALASVLPELSGNDRMNAALALGLTQAPTRESARALDPALQHPQLRSVAALAKGPSTIAELVPQVYQDVNPSLHPLAARSLLAGLEKLEEEGFARREGERWHPSRGATQ